MNHLDFGPSFPHLGQATMPDATEIFSDTLSLFNNGPLDEPPLEVTYGPIRSKIVSSLWHRTLSCTVLIRCDL
jgi:hypothetical protein